MSTRSASHNHDRCHGYGPFYFPHLRLKRNSDPHSPLYFESGEWRGIESERLLAGIAFDQDALYSRGIIERPNRPQTGRSSIDAVEAIAVGLVRGWVGIPIGCLNPRPLRAIPSLR